MSKPQTVAQLRIFFHLSCASIDLSNMNPNRLVIHKIGRFSPYTCAYHAVLGSNLNQSTDLCTPLLHIVPIAALCSSFAIDNPSLPSVFL